MRLNRNYIAPFAMAVLTGCLVTPKITQATEIKGSLTEKTEITYRFWYKYCSSKLGIEVSASDNQILYTHLSEWHGTPYQYGANEINTGTDCSGFISKVYANIYDLELPRTAQAMYDYVEKINDNDLQTGDLLFFRTGKTDRITHVGIYLKDGKFMHASSFHGVTVSNLEKEYYQKRFAGAARHQDMNLVEQKNTNFQKLRTKKVRLIPIENVDEITQISLAFQVAEAQEEFNQFIENQENGVYRIY